MKLLYGTGNRAKLSVMRSRLKQLDIELIGLDDLRAEGKTIPQVVEDGKSPLENARLKAIAYYEAFHIPVFSCDSGLYFDNVPEAIQPGVHVRNVNGKCLTDDEMIDYYSGLVKIYGNLVARYRNAICFVQDDTHIYEAMEPSMESEKFILTDKPHSIVRKKGFPLSSNEELSLEDKMKKRQEIQQEITNLNQQLRQHQIEQRKEQQSKKSSMDDMVAGTKNTSAKKGTGLSQAGMRAMISADSSIKQAKVQGSMATQMEGRAGVLESEIKQDAGKGNTEKKEELADLKAKAQSATAAQMSSLSDANKSMEEAAKADNRTDASDNADVKTETAETITNPASESGQSVVYTPIDIRL